MRNRVTGEYEKPDERSMIEMEGIVMGDGDDRGDFRRVLISSIGANRLDHPDEKQIDYPKVFPDLFRRLRDHYFGERKKVIRRMRDRLLPLPQRGKAQLLAKEAAQIEGMLQTMVTKTTLHPLLPRRHPLPHEAALRGVSRGGVSR